MAGYMLYSLDGNRFQKFASEPSQSQLMALANCVSEELDQYADELDEDDMLAQWPVEPAELAPVLQHRIVSNDWFADMTDQEKDIFDSALRAFFWCDEAELDCRCDSEGVYWDVIDMIRAHHRVPANTVNEKVSSQFGTQPFRARLEQGKTPGFDTWAPYHSVHLPEDVKNLRDEVLAAEGAVMDSDDEDAKEQYEDELVPTLDRVAEQNRVLLVILDT